MPTLFRDLDGGYLVPYLNGKTNEQWQSSNTANTNVQLAASPIAAGINSVLVSPSAVTINNLLLNSLGDFETYDGSGWNTTNNATTGGIVVNTLGTRTAGVAYNGNYMMGINGSTTANHGVLRSITGGAGTYTFQVALKNGPGALPGMRWQIGVGYTTGVLATGTNTNVVDVSLTNNWQVFYVTAVLDGSNGFPQVWIRNNASATGSPANMVYYDAAMLYVGNYKQVVPYTDTWNNGLNLYSGTSDGASLPNFAGLAAGTSTLDVRVRLQVASFNFNSTIINQLGSGANDRWSLNLITGDKLTATWKNLAGTTQTATASATTSLSTATYVWVRALINLGAGTVDFYRATDSTGTTWTAIGVQQTGFSTTGLNATGTTPPVTLGGTGMTIDPDVLATKILVGGSTVVDIDWTTFATGRGPWTGAVGGTWTGINNAQTIKRVTTVYINTNAYSPTQYDLTDYDGVGFFLYSPTAQNLDHVRVRFYTEDPTTAYPGYFEINVQPQGTGSTAGIQTLYGAGLYGSSVYSIVGATTVNWTEFIVPKENFAVVGTPSWGKITRTEVTPFLLGTSIASLYVNAISGWVNPLSEDNSANRIMNRLPNFYWDTDYYRQLCQQAGYELDCLKATLRYGLDQRFIDFAEWGLRLWEKQYQLPIEPVSPMLKRRALAKILFAQVGSKAEFIDYLSDIADGGVQITEIYGSYAVLVNAAVNTLSARNQLVLALSKTIPAHLQVSVSYNAFVAGVGIVGSGLGPSYFQGTGESASFVDNAVKT